MSTIATLAAHADWSVDPGKRFFTRAVRREGKWTLDAPEPVGEPGDLLARLLAMAGGGAVAFGGDFPLGLPRAYAARAGIADFPRWLRGLTGDDPVFKVCTKLGEISLARPFYPRARVSGGGQMALFSERLGFADAGELRRRVDLPTARRRGGAPLFWTLGANQCGKAGLSAWLSCLLPAFAARLPVALWPYEGGFVELLAPGRVVVAETYPAEALVQLGLALKGSKRRQADRARLAPALLAAMDRLGAIAAENLVHAMADGFGARADGEDRFDSLLGVLNVISVIEGAPDGVPEDPAIRAVEGWVLGQCDPPVLPASASAPPMRGRTPLPARRSRRGGPQPGGSG